MTLATDISKSAFNKINTSIRSVVHGSGRQIPIMLAFLAELLFRALQKANGYSEATAKDSPAAWMHSIKR